MRVLLAACVHLAYVNVIAALIDDALIARANMRLRLGASVEWHEGTDRTKRPIHACYAALQAKFEAAGSTTEPQKGSKSRMLPPLDAVTSRILVLSFLLIR